MVRLYRYVLYFYSVQDRLWRLPGDIYPQAVQPLRYSFDCKRPKHFINHVGPHVSTVKQECASSCCENFYFIFYDSVLVVHAYAIECDLLIFPINSVDETIVSKPAGVGMLVLIGLSSMCHDFLHC